MAEPARRLPPRVRGGPAVRGPAAQRTRKTGKRQYGSSRAIASGGQNTERPSRICGTPIRSSGASCVPSRLTHSRPRDSANFLTREDFPMPGAPQRNTGRTVARPRRSSGIWVGVTVTAACKRWAPPRGMCCSVNVWGRRGQSHLVFTVLPMCRCADVPLGSSVGDNWCGGRLGVPGPSPERGKRRGGRRAASTETVATGIDSGPLPELRRRSPICAAGRRWSRCRSSTA